MSRFLVFLSAASICACVSGPMTGTTFSGAIVGATLTASGYDIAPGNPVYVDVLNAPGLDPNVGSNWTQIGATTGSSSAVNFNGSPLYAWSVNVVPVPSATFRSRWPDGGTVKFRVRLRSGLAIVPDLVTANACLGAEQAAGTPGQAAIVICRGIDELASTAVSTLNNPANTPGSRQFLALKGDVDDAETRRYYEANDAPARLADFKARYRYPGSGDITASYYNDGDLGIGREMHCWKSLPDYIACYVTNYSDRDGEANFGTNDVAATLDRTVAHRGGFATVAMVQVLSEPRNSVRFSVFNAAGERDNFARLDNLNAHTSIPNNCLTCHGLQARYDRSTHTVTGKVSFLPFDLESYLYGATASRTSQEEAFRKLNALVRDTNPAPAITDFINGAYHGAVATAGTAFDDHYLPSGWDLRENNDARTLYNGVVKVGCRSCHMSAERADLDFLQFIDFRDQSELIGNHVCVPGDGRFMPHAEHVMRKFWASGARAYLSAWFGYSLSPTANAANRERAANLAKCNP